ncbi:MAG TPA: Flp pilus assembly protein CpaB, partial [Pirellulaceae bacterium]
MVLILIALGCGLIASIGISQVMEKNANNNAALKTSPIYVSAIDMAAGEDLTSQKIKLEEWPVDKLPEGAVTSPEQLEGKSPTMRLYAGEPLLLAKLADRDRIRGTAVKIRKGYRVMSINVDAASAVAGLVSPGDHVDVMVFMRGHGGGDKAEPVLENIEVFAVNDQIQRDVDSEGR